MANPSRLQSTLQHLFTVVLVLAIAGMLGWLSTRYSYRADWTAQHSNSLSDASKRLLDTMKDPIKITAYVYPDQMVRREVTAYVKPYQRYKANVELHFVDPATSPDEVRKMNISQNGEVVVEYQGRRENLRVIGEQAMTNALERLAYSGESWIIFLEGHGERNVNGDAQADYGDIAKELRNKGLKVQALNLVRTPKIPDNTAAVVLASPTKPLLPGEVEQLRAYVKKGGNLLWLSDPERPAGLDALADDLSIDWLKGTLIYPDFQIMGTGHPANAIIVDYGQGPITRDFGSDATQLPYAGGVKSREGSGWKAEPLLMSLERSWLETANLKGNLALEEKSGDTRGPITVGLTLTRTRPGAKEPEMDFSSKIEPPQQRVVAIADSDFMANAYLKVPGNLLLAINTIQWLANRDAQINIHVPPAPDAQLSLKPWAFIVIAVSFIGLVPLMLVLTGAGRWWLRRRK